MAQSAFFNQGAPVFGVVPVIYPSGQMVTTIYTSPQLAQTEQYQSPLSINLVKSKYAVPFVQKSTLEFPAAIKLFTSNQEQYGLFLNLLQEPLAQAGLVQQRQIAGILTANQMVERAYRYFVKKSSVMESAQGFLNTAASGWQQTVIPGLPKEIAAIINNSQTGLKIANYLRSSPPNVSGAASLGTEKVSIWVYIPVEQRKPFEAIQTFMNAMLQSTDEAIRELDVYAPPRTVINCPSRYAYDPEIDRALRRQPIYYNREFYTLSPSMIEGMKPSLTIALTGSWTFIPISKYKAGIQEALSANVLQANSVHPALSTLQDGLGKEVMLPLAIGTLIPAFQVSIKGLDNSTALSAVFEALIAHLLIPLLQMEPMAALRYNNVIAAYIAQMFGIQAFPVSMILSSGRDMLWIILNMLPVTGRAQRLRHAMLAYLGGAPGDVNGWAAAGYRTATYPINDELFASYGVVVQANLYGVGQYYDVQEDYPDQRFQALQEIAVGLRVQTQNETIGFSSTNPYGLAAMIQGVTSTAYQAFLYAWNTMAQNASTLPMFTSREPDRRVPIYIVSSALTSFITTVTSFKTTTTPVSVFYDSLAELSATSFQLNWLHQQNQNANAASPAFQRAFRGNLYEVLMPLKSELNSQMIQLYTKIEAQKAPDYEYTKSQFWKAVEAYVIQPVADYDLYQGFYNRAVRDRIVLEYPYTETVALVYLPISLEPINNMTIETISTYLSTTPAPGTLAYVGLGDVGDNSAFKYYTDLINLITFLTADGGRNWQTFVANTTANNLIGGLIVTTAGKISTDFVTRSAFASGKYPKLVNVTGINDAQQVMNLFTTLSVVDGVNTATPKLVEVSDAYIYEEENQGPINTRDQSAIATWLTGIGRGWYLMPIQSRIQPVSPIVDVVTSRLTKLAVPTQEYNIVKPEVEYTVVPAN